MNSKNRSSFLTPQSMLKKSILALAISAICIPAQAAKVQLRIMETTDIHVNIVDYDYYRDKSSNTLGLSKTATLIKAARAEVKNSLLFDNGDLIQGNPLGDYIAKEQGLADGQIHPVFKAMNTLNYDAANLGNHEFNYGLEFLKNAISGANFPYVSANTYVYDGDSDDSNDQNYFTPYQILERELTAEDGSKVQMKVGVIGFVPPQITQWDKVNLDGKLIAHDIVADAKKFIPMMRSEGADIVVVIPHSGIGKLDAGQLAENSTLALSKIPGIDAILFGHSHQPFPSDKYAQVAGADIAKGTLNGVPSVMPGFWGSHLGLVDLQLEVIDGKWKVLDGQGSLRAIYKRDGRKKIPLVEADPVIASVVAKEHQATIDYMNKGVGTTTAPIHSYFSLVQDDPSVQIVTNAQKRYVEKLIQGTEYDGIPVLSAGAPFKAGGRGGADYYTNISAGKIALKNVADLYIYPNTLRAVLLNGAQVREWLEMSMGAFNTIKANTSEEQPLLNPQFPSYNFDIIDGVSFKVDLSQAARYAKDGSKVSDTRRIINLQYQGIAVQEDQTFIVATNNYRASGGGNFPALDGSNIIISAPDENRTVLANDIFALKTIDPSADKNWSFSAIENVNVTFESSPNARSAITADMPISYVGEAKDGFAKYRLSLQN
ncbi:MAG: bifunctional 2',3'-cyclic-nucleotide 2'-phosphodiesterase/3'-nucleotidase [Pseudomonadales bacterium]|nr:bifunctional 2',3'-cyclic-nucleotide 2'-phosphodiesterase/3'-nucleotidase [Pseudomonadales bacterium]NRA16378.1 bifunctional 2',3'-cyclic-nucleotide 2'-phosphodiesterase/3'-nucleotidase [Oceanospirillaceae bacterium]